MCFSKLELKKINKIKSRTTMTLTRKKNGKTSNSKNKTKQTKKRNLVFFFCSPAQTQNGEKRQESCMSYRGRTITAGVCRRGIIDMTSLHYFSFPGQATVHMCCGEYLSVNLHNFNSDIWAAVELSPSKCAR